MALYPVSHGGTPELTLLTAWTSVWVDVWPIALLTGQPACRLADWLVVWLAVWLIGELSGWVSGRPAGRVVCRDQAGGWRPVSRGCVSFSAAVLALTERPV